MSIDCEQVTVGENSNVEQRMSCFSNDNSVVATGLSDGTIKLWTVQKEKINNNNNNSNNNKDKKNKGNKQKSKKGKKNDEEKEEKKERENEEENEEESIPIDTYKYSLVYIKEINHRKSAIKDMSFNPKYDYLGVVYDDGYCEIINLKNSSSSLVLEPPHIDIDDSNNTIKTIIKRGKFLSDSEFVCSYTSAKKGYIVCVYIIYIYIIV